MFAEEVDNGRMAQSLSLTESEAAAHGLLKLASQHLVSLRAPPGGDGGGGQELIYPSLHQNEMSSKFVIKV